MSYINFDKHQLVNLEYSLNKELLRVNRSGSYSCTTLIRCNTRKYHGLLVCPQVSLNNEHHILLSSLDETIIQNEEQFNLSVHQFKGGVFHPKGHKYLRELVMAPTPKMIYNVGGVIFSKEAMFTSGKDCYIIKYTLEQAHSATTLRIRPFLAFRPIHQLSKHNDQVDRSYSLVEKGIKVRMYEGYSDLYLQSSKKADYVHEPDWHYDFEYAQEIERGYEACEDLYVPGYFDVSLKTGESVYFSASTEETASPESSLKRLFASEVKKRTPRDSFEHSLQNAAEQLIVTREQNVGIFAAFPWMSDSTRFSFIALPGLTLSVGDSKTCKKILDHLLSSLQGSLFPLRSSEKNSPCSAIDIPLWFIWALQNYGTYTQTPSADLWKTYGTKIKTILDGYRKGLDYNIRMLDNGLLQGGIAGQALSWMDAIAEGVPVTPRIGLCVEVNALWYNALCYSLQLAESAGDKSFVKTWKPTVDTLPASFKDTFWSKEKGYLADYVNGDYKDFSVRCNQILAAGLPYSPLSDKIQQLVLEKTKQDLLTPRGLRTLTPNHEDYKPYYTGNAFQRDHAYHQGSVWVWPLRFFAEAYLRVYGKSALPLIENIYQGFEKTLTEYCVGSIAELYDGDPPHHPRSAISHAGSVAALLRIHELIQEYKTTQKATTR